MASRLFAQPFVRWTMDSLHKGPVARKMFPFDDVIMALNHVKILPIMLYPIRYSWVEVKSAAGKSSLNIFYEEQYKEQIMLKH